MGRVNHRIAPVFKRKGDMRKPKQNILIVTEGEQTEPNYLEGWLNSHNARQKANIRVVGMGESTSRLLIEAEMLNREQQRRTGYGYDQVWIVMDYDENPDFDACIAMAEQKGFQVAWTNNAFELWLCLHFSFMQSQLTREGYVSNFEAAVRKFVPKYIYSKSDNNLYELLHKYGDEEAATERAKKLMACYVGRNPSQCEPGTTIYQLLEAMEDVVK